MTRLHAVITGSLHKGNIGDNSLLRAFVDQHKDKYQKLTVIGANSQNLLSVDHSTFYPPQMAIGYCFWKGHKERTKTRKMITEQIPDSMRHYVWLGGLLGPNVYHKRLRYKELNWASSFCNTLIYYFGDVEPEYNNSTESRMIIDSINRFNSWISVRSNEAADLLIDAGYRSKIYVGIDPVLYARCKRLGTPFSRSKNNSGSLAIVVCNHLAEKSLPIWRAAALSAIKLGLKILWVSLCDSEDLTLCKQLFREFSKQNPKHLMEIICGVNGESKIAESSVCVATRFHGAIFSLTAGVPTIAVPYGAKIQRLFKFMNLEDWVADPLLNSQNNVDWNSTIHEMMKAALEGKWQPDYTRLKAGIKAHEDALSELDLIFPNLVALK